MRFIVITGVPTGDPGQNYADSMAFYHGGHLCFGDKPSARLTQMHVKMQVFYRGELLVCYDDGREIGYPHRYAQLQSGIKYEEFLDVKQAIDRVREVQCA